jgi:hypothetical protein
MSPDDPEPGRKGTSTTFGFMAIMVGIVSGGAGVAVARAAFGPGTAVAGAAIGLVAGIPASLWFSSSRRHRRPAPRLAGGHRLRRRTHAVGWIGPVSGSLLTVVAWSAVAHSSGSGWVQAVGALLAAVLTTGLVAPLFPAFRARATCSASPSDGTAGRPSTLTLVTNGPLRVRPLDPPGPTAMAGGRARGQREVTVEVVPQHRGVFDSVAVEVASSAPFGMVWWAREVVVQLERPIHVAPRTGEPGPTEHGADDRSGEAERRIAGPTGESRGVRPYQVGDLRRVIHWPATAHAGSLMISEAEQPADQPVVVEVVLPTDPEAAERTAEHVMADVAHHLARGVPVLLITLEPTGKTVGTILDRVELGRRLARAVAPGPA